MKTPIEKLLEIITLKEKENAIFLMPIIDKVDIDKLISEEKQLLIQLVSNSLDLDEIENLLDLAYMNVEGDGFSDENDVIKSKNEWREKIGYNKQN